MLPGCYFRSIPVTRGEGTMHRSTINPAEISTDNGVVENI
jgi:hypothetical protein